MLLKQEDRPLLKERLVKDITKMLENEYVAFIKVRGKSHLVQTDDENYQEFLYALFIAHVTAFIYRNDYIVGSLLYTYFLRNNNTLNNFYTYLDTEYYSDESYVKHFLEELYLTF